MVRRLHTKTIGLANVTKGTNTAQKRYVKHSVLGTATDDG